jgi:ABC-type nitrate/sulfonate/bicarbonate transport system substrate-binding protein
MKLAVPDMISNSYFPAEAAIELGFFREEGLDVTLEMIFPVDKAYMALRDGTVDFVGGSAHSALAAFPQWDGVKLICAQAQGMYWFLVMHKDFAARRGDINAVKGKSIGAAPWVDMGLRRLLIAAGIDLARDGVTIAPVSGSPRQRLWKIARSTVSGRTAWVQKLRSAAALATSCSTSGAVTDRKAASTTRWHRSRPRTA